MENMANESLLNALLECFEKLDIDYVENVTIDGEDGYQIISNSDIVTIWETYFCSAMVKLSTSPRSHSATLNPDVLRTWRRGEVNDKTKNTLRKKYIPNISATNGYTYIDAQKEHIISFLELAICASESEPDFDKRSINNEKYWYKKKLIERDRILPNIYSKFGMLKELFEDVPIHIIANRDDIRWFSDTITDKMPEVDNDEAERLFAAVFAAAMVLSLNIKKAEEIPENESASVDNRIKEYLERLVDDSTKRTEDAPKREQSDEAEEVKRNVLRIFRSGNNDVEIKKAELIGAFDSLRQAKNENLILESMIRIKRTIGKCFVSAEDFFRNLPDDDSDELSRGWIECAYQLKDMITEIVAYYRVVLERDLLLQESNEQEMTSLKIDILDNAVEIYIILGFLEAQLKKESEELNRSAGIIEKVQQIQFKIRKTKMDLSNIRRENDSAEAELFNSIAERSTSINYDKGTI